MVPPKPSELPGYRRGPFRSRGQQAGVVYGHVEFFSARRQRHQFNSIQGHAIQFDPDNMVSAEYQDGPGFSPILAGEGTKAVTVQPPFVVARRAQPVPPSFRQPTRAAIINIRMRR